MKLRLFCALPVSSEVGQELKATAASLRGQFKPASLSWVKPENLHLTLSFLGDVEETRVPELAGQLERVCAVNAPFELVAGQMGCFPNLNRPRVLWAGVQSQGQELSRLQKEVARVCIPFAVKEEKSRFAGHITLGRFRPDGVPPADLLIQEIERYRTTVFGRWEVGGVDLFQSDLSQGSPRYSVLKYFPFAR